MTTATMAAAAIAPQPETDPRIAIWSLSAQVIGAYFVIFLVQYAPAVALTAYTQWPASDGATLTTMTLALAAVNIIAASGPIGLGSATNALAIAITVEATMVLAKIIGMHQREQGLRQGREEGRAEGIEQGIEQERKRRKRNNKARKARNAQLRALAEQYGIPEDALPLEDVDDDEDDDLA